jgi:hypothetical protein
MPEMARADAMPRSKNSPNSVILDFSWPRATPILYFCVPAVLPFSAAVSLIFRRVLDVLSKFEVSGLESPRAQGNCLLP